MVQKELKPSPQKENLNLKENEMTKISVREPEKKNEFPKEMRVTTVNFPLEEFSFGLFFFQSSNRAQTFC